MGYRGDDLDIRTPQTWRATAAAPVHPAPAAQAGGGRGTVQQSGPIWVDETVLAACNHAFDVALAHRSGEVRLEHFLHALTRLDTSAEILEARGIRVTALRRELGTIIASELPMGLPNGRGAPRRSEDFEDVLRLGAALAAPRDEPADVNDVLHAIIESSPHIPVVADIAHTLSHAANTYGAGTAGLSGSTRGHGAQRAGITPTATDNLQNTRLDTLEQMVRALTTDLQNERKVFTGVLQELQREIMTHRDDINRPQGGHLQSDLGDRLKGLEQSVQSSRFASAVDLGPVLERLVALERSILSGRGEQIDFTPVISRLDRIEVAVAASDTPSLGAALEKHRSEIAVSVLTPLIQRIDGVMGAIDERIAKLEASTNETIAKIQEQVTAHAQAQSETSDALTKLNDNHSALSGSIEQWRLDSAVEIGGVDDKLKEFDSGLSDIDTRLAALEAESSKPVEMLHALSGTLNRMHKVTVERYYRRNRFWYWLFGTDDWVAASWPSQAARIADDLDAVKNTPDS